MYFQKLEIHKTLELKIAWHFYLWGFTQNSPSNDLFLQENKREDNTIRCVVHKQWENDVMLRYIVHGMALLILPLFTKANSSYCK